MRLKSTKLHERITELRDRAGLTRNALAVTAGIDAAYLMRLERGEVAQPNFETICRLAEALGASLDDFKTCDYLEKSRKKAI